jgi:DNA-binding HxlR family transcriptional regulator
MPATDAQPRPCAIADALELIGERWSLLIVRELFWGAHRFGEIARNTGAPRDILTTRLRRLVEAGVVEKRPYSERPPRSEYHLTAAGRELSPVLMALQEWSFKHVDADGPRRPRFPHHEHELEPVSDFHCGVCGERVR